MTQRLMSIRIWVDDEEGKIVVDLPDLSTYQTNKVEKALSFLRREIAYRTAPTSTIWKD